MVYDLGNGEFPPQPHDLNLKKKKHMVINAYTCLQEEATRLQNKAKKRKKGK